MKIPQDFIIAPAKLRYLLTPRAKADKSGFLLDLGFGQDQPEQLEAAIRSAVAAGDALEDRRNKFGAFYVVRQPLTGPTQTQRAVRIIVQLRLDAVWSFVTLFPDRS